VLSQEAAPRFIARKLVRYFVCDEPNIPDTLVEPLAVELRDSDFHVGPTVRRILTSRFFFSEHAMARKFRSPVELAIGLVRSLEGTTSTTELSAALRPLGQVLFYPPSVKGWDGGRTWINATTLLGRANLVRTIVDLPASQFAGGTLVDLAEKHQLDEATETVQWLADLLLAATLGSAAREPLVALARGHQSDRRAQLATIIHAMSTLPEFQLA
jgi:uncharacterized protein (DUF1800 family)